VTAARFLDVGLAEVAVSTTFRMLVPWLLMLSPVALKSKLMNLSFLFIRHDYYRS